VVSLIVLSLVILMMLTISIIAKKENSIATKGITIEKSKQIAILALKKRLHRFNQAPAPIWSQRPVLTY